MQNKNFFVSTSTRVKVSCLCLNKDNHPTLARRDKNLMRFLNSFMLLPILTVAMPFGSLFGTTIKTDMDTSPQIVLSIQQNMQANGLSLNSLTFNQAIDPKIDLEAKVLQAQAEAIDTYFGVRQMPLKGLGMKMAEEAEKNGLDYRLIPAIAVRESTGGKHDCLKVKNNPFGLGSCKIGFKSNEEAIETLARNLGGNNPNTKHHYSGKATEEILKKYNPPSVVRNYAAQVMSIMNAIGKEDLATVANAIS